MNTIFFISVALFTTVSLSSCKKDWTCTCVWEGPAGQSIVNFQITRSTKSQAISICNQDALNLDTVTYNATQGTATGLWSCTL